ncbi:MAG TPA: amidohydrolase family protein, partial [Candidatus Saccharimonadia bacterium]|nr:amidohydrolase family protein [Candidatus Saccharimonadia bacterium]
MNATRGSWVFLALLAFEGASAAEPSAANERFAITAQRVLDIERGRYLEGTVVLVAGERIEKVVPRKELDPALRVVDLGEVTLLPGLIDAHTHLLADTGDSYSAMLLTKSQAYRALEGAAHAKRTLHAGFTTVRDVENEGAQYADVALRDAIARGLVEGPRMRVATRGIAAVGQYMPFDISPDHAGFPRGAQLVSGVDEVRRAAREQLGNGADHLKVYADWDHPTLTLDEIRVAVEEAKKAGKRVVVHATTPEAIRNAVEAGAVSIEHGMFADRATLELLAKKRVWLVPTLTALADAIEAEESPEARASLSVLLKAMKANLALAHELGVPLAMGSD